MATETLVTCAACGKGTLHEDVRGSMKHPVCKECFQEIWQDDFDKYYEYVEATHTIA